MSVEVNDQPTGNPVIDHLDLWSSVYVKKAASGRGGSGKISPYGINKLRELILELAVRGKLVPQDPDDEPADVLLEKITKEKKQLVKDGKLKKQKALPPIVGDETPFELPLGWEWAWLGAVSKKITDGTHHSPPNTETGEFLYISARNIKNDGVLLDNATYVTRKVHEEIYERCDPVQGDLLYIKDGATTGVATINDLSEPFSMLSSVALLKVPRGLLNTYLLLCLRSPFFYAEMRAGMTGVAITRVTLKKLNNALIPLPPAREQHRIVAKVDELMALCDQLEQQQTDNLQAHQTLVETLLNTLVDAGDAESTQQAWNRIAEHFDTLFTTEESIDQLKQTILQLAVMGRLVPQDPEDEPGSALLEEIAEKRESALAGGYPNEAELKTQQRKQKKQKLPSKLPPLPIGWAWATLMQCSLIVVDCHNKTAPYEESGIALLRTSNIRNGELVHEDIRYVSDMTFERWAARTIPNAGDILITREAPMGEVCILPDDQQYCMGQRMMLMRLVPQTIDPHFMLVSLRDPDLMERVQDKPVGMTVQHLRVGGVETLLVPVPPLAEQNRIVAKVDELMALCNQLKIHIQEAQTTQVHLADAVVEQAVA